MNLVHVYDSTAQDEQSRVRGVGRYLQILHEAFGNEWTFTSDMNQIPKESIFINPFFNPIQKPLKVGRIAKHEIAIIHDLIPLKYSKHFPLGIKGKWYRFLNGFALKNYDIIVTDSLASKNDIVKLLKIPASKIAVIYPSVPRIFLPHVDPDDPHHPFHKENETVVPEFTQLQSEHVTKNPVLEELKDYVIYVGDATWNKNLVNLAQAIKMNNLTCVFVGKVFSQLTELTKAKKPHPEHISLYEFAKLAEGDNKFIFPGYISDIELLYLYKNARLNILPSFDEGFGFSFLEAGYVSTPSVLADTAVFREIAKDSAEFAKPDDPKDIAQKMIELYYDTIKLEKMKIKSFARAQDFSPQSFKEAWKKLLGQ